MARWARLALCKLMEPEPNLRVWAIAARKAVGAEPASSTERGMGIMGIFRRQVPRHYVPIHPDNIATNDWIILLEAGTIVGAAAEKLRVAKATLERKIVTKHNIFLRKTHFLVLEGYDPRIHALYFCPQLYKLDSDNKPVALDGEEIGKLLAQSVRDGVVERQPWYEPSRTLPHEPVIAATTDRARFDTLIVEDGADRKAAAVEDGAGRKAAA
jgi:hypothetical protein